MSIFGTPDALISEYKRLLASKLLGRAGIDMEAETLVVELLKVRFGEASMVECQVIVRSRRRAFRKRHF